MPLDETCVCVCVCHKSSSCASLDDESVAAEELFEFVALDAYV